MIRMRTTRRSLGAALGGLLTGLLFLGAPAPAVALDGHEDGEDEDED